MCWSMTVDMWVDESVDCASMHRPARESTDTPAMWQSSIGRSDGQAAVNAQLICRGRLDRPTEHWHSDRHRSTSTVSAQVAQARWCIMGNMSTVGFYKDLYGRLRSIAKLEFYWNIKAETSISCLCVCFLVTAAIPARSSRFIASYASLTLPLWVTSRWLGKVSQRSFPRSIRGLGNPLLKTAEPDRAAEIESTVDYPRSVCKSLSPCSPRICVGQDTEQVQNLFCVCVGDLSFVGVHCGRRRERRPTASGSKHYASEISWWRFRASSGELTCQWRQRPFYWTVARGNYWISTGSNHMWDGILIRFGNGSRVLATILRFTGAR